MTFAGGDDNGIARRKKEMKRKLFRIVANQTGKLFDENVLTIVWARRFAAYKRANLLLANYDRLGEDLRAELPLKRIWAVASAEGEE